MQVTLSMSGKFNEDRVHLEDIATRVIKVKKRCNVEGCPAAGVTQYLSIFSTAHTRFIHQSTGPFKVLRCGQPRLTKLEPNLSKRTRVHNEMASRHFVPAGDNEVVCRTGPGPRKCNRRAGLIFYISHDIQV